MEPGNGELWDLLNFSAGTWLMGRNGPYAVNFSHLRELSELLGMELNRTALLKIRTYERAYLEMKTEPNG